MLQLIDDANSHFCQYFEVKTCEYPQEAFANHPGGAAAIADRTFQTRGSDWIKPQLKRDETCAQNAISTTTFTSQVCLELSESEMWRQKHTFFLTVLGTTEWTLTGAFYCFVSDVARKHFLRTSSCDSSMKSYTLVPSKSFLISLNIKLSANRHCIV